MVNIDPDIVLEPFQSNNKLTVPSQIEEAISSCIINTCISDLNDERERGRSRSYLTKSENITVSIKIRMPQSDVLYNILTIGTRILFTDFKIWWQ